MSVFRRLSTRRLIALLGSAISIGVASAIAAAVLSGGAGAAPAGQPLAQAIHAAFSGSAPDGVTARVQFTNNLLPSSSMLGNATSALLSGASGRLWLTNDGRGRIELQSDAGDTQVVWDSSKLTVYDASSNTAYELALPAHAASSSSASPSVPSLDRISSALAQLEQHANVSDAQPGVTAGESSYSVSVSPKTNGGLFGDAELAWDASNGVPLRVAITAKGDSSPVLALQVTDISFGAVSSSDVAIPPPSGAKIVDVAPKQSGSHSESPPVTGVDAVRAAVGFPLVAPASVNGMALSSARLVGKGALLTYGEGLGALVVHERATDNPSASSLGSALGGLPKVSLGSVSASELATPLGTVLSFDHGGVSFVVGGSMTTADAEAAAHLFA